MEIQQHFLQSNLENDLRQAIVLAGRIAYQQGLMPASDGNISVRLDDGGILITPSGVCKGRLVPEELLLIDTEGKPLDEARAARPSIETRMHLEVYRQRPDIKAAIHAHPPLCTAISVAGIPLKADMLAEVLMTLGEVPTAAFGLPGTQQAAEAIREWIRTHDAIILRQHGTLTIGLDLETALLHLERIEHAATIFTFARLLGRVDSLPEDAIQAIRRNRNPGPAADPADS